MKYIILEKGRGEGCDYTIGCNQRWEIVDHDGDVNLLVEKYTKMGIYGGDETGNPEDYNKIDDYYTGGLVVELIIISVDQLVNVDMKAAVDNHNRLHQKIVDNEQELKDKATYEKLKEKFS